MITEYTLSSPRGDIPLSPDDFAIPFKVSPSENHPSLTLGDYFRAVRAFVMEDKQPPFTVSVYDKASGRTFLSKDIRKMVIRSEKHGALYHVASVHISVLRGTDPVKFAVSTAVSGWGRECLGREYNLLRRLNKTFESKYLPRPYQMGDVICKNGEILSMCLSEWFEDFYEWHYHCLDNKGKRQKIRIWDMERGYRNATGQEAFDIFKKVSKILTSYYNINDGSHIFPWHHAAGDFVVRCRDGKTDVRLTTVRGYDSIIEPGLNSISDPILALVYFLLNMTVKMRLDKLDGTGEVVWADDFVPEATIQGFFEALLVKKADDVYDPGMREKILSLLKSFNRDELKMLVCSMLDIYPEEEPNDLSAIKANMDSHVMQLYRVLQEYTL